MKKISILFIIATLLLCGCRHVGTPHSSTSDSTNTRIEHTQLDNKTENVKPIADLPAQYTDVVEDYLKIVQYRLSDDFLQSENLSSLQQQLVSGLFDDASEVDGETLSLQTRWQNMVVDMLDYISEPDVASFGYILKDLDGDSNLELIWVSADYNTVFAIFTIADNKAVLVDAYWPRYKAVILDSGAVYTLGSGGANTSQYICWTLNKDQPDYKNIQKQFGINDGQYYEEIKNAPVNISKDRFDALLLEHPFQAGNTWKDNALYLLR